jgi:hypothetical protein
MGFAKQIQRLNKESQEIYDKEKEIYKLYDIQDGGETHKITNTEHKKELAKLKIRWKEIEHERKKIDLKIRKRDKLNKILFIAFLIVLFLSLLIAILKFS